MAPPQTRQPFTMIRNTSSSQVRVITKRPVILLRQSIENRNIQEAIHAASSLEGEKVSVDDWCYCLKELFVSLDNLGIDDDAQWRSLLGRLLDHGDDDKRFDLIAHIIRVKIAEGQDNELRDSQAYFEIITSLLSVFPQLAAHVRRRRNIFHLAADVGVTKIISIAKQKIEDKVLLRTALMLKDNGGDTPLAIAVKNKYLEIVRELAEDATSEMITPTILLNTLTKEHYSILQTLVCPGPRSNLVTIELLKKAILNGSIQTWDYLIDMYPSTSIDESDLLKSAVVKRRDDIVESLLKKKPEMALWIDDEGENRSVLYYNVPLVNESPDVQQKIRDAIALKIIEASGPNPKACKVGQFLILYHH
jgi:hypothetical protein